MKSPAFGLVLVCLLGLFLAGCASSDVISAGPDTYMVSASGVGFATAGVREAVYKKANDFCAARGLVMVPVSLKVREGAIAQHPTIARPMLTGDDEKLANTQVIKLSVKDEPKKEGPVDTYTEILKLDDLRKRGLITDAEFEKQKQKLLESK